jgi:hypothetical protein
MHKPEAGSIATYRQFWLFYLREHHRSWTRRWHIAGTLLAITCAVAAIALANPWLLLAAAFAGYGPAWMAHFVVEKNQPATWRYPLWSLASDFRMTLAWLSGNLDHELRKAGIDSRQD